MPVRPVRAAVPAEATKAPADIASAAVVSSANVLRGLAVTGETGLEGGEVLRRQTQLGPNAVASHRANALVVLRHQLRSPLLFLLLLLPARSTSSESAAQR